MTEDLEILKTLVKAKELGVSMDDVEAFKAKQKVSVPETKAEDIVTPMSILDEFSEEEILFYATPYFDELQNKKEAQKQKLAEENTK